MIPKIRQQAAFLFSRPLRRASGLGGIWWKKFRRLSRNAIVNPRRAFFTADREIPSQMLVSSSARPSNAASKKPLLARAECEAGNLVVKQRPGQRARAAHFYLARQANDMRPLDDLVRRLRIGVLPRAI